MDISATQVFDDYDASTQKVCSSSQHNKQKQIGVLHIESNTYPVKKGMNIIGRQPECDIVINNQTVSKKHAEIEADSHEAIWICDLHSSNGTKLNNSTLRPGRLYQLKDGSMLEFGSSRAVYKSYCASDDFVIPETPAPIRTKEHQLSIPETPNSSMNNSTDTGNVSTVPATQNNEGRTAPLFRHPSLPLRSSTGSNQTDGSQDLFMDNSLNSSGSFVTKRKESMSEQSISIDNMETQNDSYNGTNIHDVETQKIRVNTVTKRLSEQFRDDINDAKTQKGKNANSSATDIHDIETQHENDKLAKLKICNTGKQRDVDIHDMVTPKKGVIVRGENDAQMSEINNESSTSIKRDMIHDRVTQRIEIKRNIPCSNDNKNNDDEIKKCSQSLLMKFATELPDLDESRILVSSPNMLENYLDESDDSIAGPATEGLSSRINANKKSTDDENLFDTATQVNKFDRNASKDLTRGSDLCKGSLPASDSDTEEGGVFQSYLYNQSQDDVIRITRANNPPQSQESDGSTTDEESQFAELAVSVRASTSNSFDVKLNESRNTNDDNNSSKDSEDIFDKPTQPPKVNSSRLSCHQSENNTNDETCNARKQTGNTMSIDIKVNESAKIEIDGREQMENTSVTTKKNSDDEDITEMEDNSPTQILSVLEKTSNSANEPSLSIGVEECSVRDIEYEMAPTQRISDIGVPSSSKDPSTSSNRVNLNDTIERNLDAMFDDVNKESVEEQDELSTQVLRDVLQSPKRLADVDSNSPTRSKSTESTSERESMVLAINSMANEKSNEENANTDDYSQATENYFYTLTSKRKSNIIADSQNFVEISEQIENKTKKIETATESTNINVRNTPKSMSKNSKLVKSTTKSPATPKSNRQNMPLKSVTKEEITLRSSKRKKQKESETVETVTESVDTSKNDNNTAEDVENKIFNTASITGKDDNQSCNSIIDSDEDLLANLPEVTISGTLTNPGSPTSTSSSEYRININHNLEKQVSIRIAPKQKRGRKSRAPVSRKSIKNTESFTDNKFISSTGSETSSNSIDVINVFANKGKRAARKSTTGDKPRNTNSLSESKPDPNESLKTESQKPPIEVNQTIVTRRSKVSDFQSKTIVASVDSEKEAVSIKVNRRPRNSKKKEADVSSLLQVGKKVSTAKVATEPAKENILNESCSTRTRKRNLNAMDANESNFRKKLKKDSSEDEPDVSRGNKRNAVVSKRRSSTLLNYVTRNNSPASASNLNSARSTPSELGMDKQMMIRLERVSIASPTNTVGSISPITRAELIPENDNKNKTKRQTRRATTANNQSTLNFSLDKDNNTTRNTNEMTGKKANTTIGEISSEIGEESQEIEMIMSGVLKKPNSVSNTESKKGTSKTTKPTKTRGNRKRGNISTDTDNTENSSSSIVYESDNAQFEVPVSKPKRARNTLNVTNTTLNVPTNETKKNNKTSARQSRANNKLVKKGVEETSLSSSDISSELSSVSVTPNRTRRSMSTSFSMSMPSKTKHRILFTGISGNDYTKVISKLGASQVEDIKKCTVLVTDKVRRTFKFLCAIAQSVPIVSIDWLVNSGKANEYMDLGSYILKDPEAEKQYKFNLAKSLEKAKNHKLLEGYTIVLTHNVAPPPLAELKTIIRTCDGKPLIRPPKSWPQKSVIITREGDITNAKEFLAEAPKTVSIHSTEFILTGILRQELNFSEFKLS